jgi:sirohydrochlorin cobaltochelatase
MGPARQEACERWVVLLDHGSREPEANAQLGALAVLLGERLAGRRIAVAHLGVAPPALADAVAECVREGAREVVVLPCFIAAGKHVREDLPRLAEEIARAHPGVSIRLAAPLGAHPAVADALAARLREFDAAAES